MTEKQLEKSTELITKINKLDFILKSSNFKKEKTDIKSMKIYFTGWNDPLVISDNEVIFKMYESAKSTIIERISLLNKEFKKI